MKQLMKHGDNAYLLIRQLPIEKFGKEEPNMEHVKVFRDWVKADHVLRTQTHFLFCETITDVEWEDVVLETME
jgi:hypothetical protein